MEPLFAAGARLDVRGMDQWDRTTVGDDLMSLAIEDEDTDVINLLIAKGYDARKHRDRWLKEAAGKPEVLRLLRAAGVKAGPADPAQAVRAR